MGNQKNETSLLSDLIALAGLFFPRSIHALPVSRF